MKLAYIIIIISISLLPTCKDGSAHRILVEKVKNKGVDTFLGLLIEPRMERDGKYVPYRFSKEIEGKSYTLPNFEFYKEEEILSPEFFDVLEFAEINGIYGDNAIPFVKKFSRKVIEDYQDLGVLKIFSNSDQGDFVVFFIDGKRFVAYVPEIKKVYGEFWQSKFKNAEVIEPMWYSGVY